MCTCGEGKRNHRCRRNENKKERVKMREKESCMNIEARVQVVLDPMLRTNTVDLQDFGLGSANPVYGPYACLEGSPGMNHGASEVHWT
jgi:hypothetical protein